MPAHVYKLYTNLYIYDANSNHHCATGLHHHPSAQKIVGKTPVTMMGPFPVFAEEVLPTMASSSRTKSMFPQRGLAARTPLGKRTNAKGSALEQHDDDDTSRKQTKKEPASQASFASLSHLDKENGQSKSEGTVEFQETKIPSLARTPPVQNLEQQAQSNNPSTSLRRSVRKTLGKSPVYSAGTHSLLNNKQQHFVELRPSRIPTPATTPRSLLSSEMTRSSANGDDDDDEALLCSPAIAHAQASMPRTSRFRSTLRRTSRPANPHKSSQAKQPNAAKTVNRSEMKCKERPTLPKTTATSKDGRSLQLIRGCGVKVEPGNDSVAASANNQKQQPIHHHVPRETHVKTELKKANRTVPISHGKAMQREGRPETAPSTSRRLPPTIAVDTSVPKSSTVPLNSTQSQWSQDLPASVFHEQKTPFTPAILPNRMPTTTASLSNKNGVCMDLSDMFCHAAASGSRPPPASRSRRGLRHVSVPIPASSRRNIQTPALTSSLSSCAPENDAWAEKQCETFSKWLNYTFHPTEEKDHAASCLDQPACEKSCNTDRPALRTLVLHQRLAQARLGAHHIFHGADFLKTRQIILSEITRGRIAVRQDRDMYADLTMRRQILDLLLSYSTPWLRLGLETVMGQDILPHVPHNFSPPAKVSGQQHPHGTVRKKRSKVRRILLSC